MLGSRKTGLNLSPGVVFSPSTGLVRQRLKTHHANQKSTMDGMSKARILKEADFDPKVCTYWLLAGGFILLVTVVGIPLIPIWILVGLIITRKYLEHMSCTLTEKSLIVRKGLLNRIEKTVPLEKITDLALKQGPVMRAMELHTLTIETAGSSGSAGGALVGLTGIVNVVDFRNQVLAQRDLLEDRKSHPGAAPAATNASDATVLEEIRDTLQRIEQHVASKG
jgi:putative membrane protein